MDKYYIPRYINEPFRLIFFTIDEIVIIALIMLPALSSGREIFGVLIVSVVLSVYKHVKRKEPTGFLQKILYWKFNLGSRHYIPSASITKFKG